MKQLLGLLCTAIIFLGFTNTVSATDRDNVATDKVWTVTLNTEMRLNEDGIKVYDAQWNPVKVKLSYGDNEKEIQVKARDAYERGSTYTLLVTDQLVSKASIPVQDEVNWTFETKPGDNNLTNHEMQEVLVEKAEAIQEVISSDLNEHLGEERDFSRVEGELQSFATDSFVQGFLKDEYLHKACGGCDRWTFLYDPDFVLDFEVLENKKDVFRVRTVSNQGVLNSGGYGTYEFKKVDGEWRMNGYTKTSFSEENHLELTALQAEKYLQGETKSVVNYVRTVEAVTNDQEEVRPYHVFEVEGRDDVYVDSYTAFHEEAGSLGLNLSDSKIKEIAEERVQAAHEIINGDINQHLGTNHPKDYSRVKPDLLEVATEAMVEGTLKDYYEKACGACDYRFFQEPEWELKYEVVENEAGHVRVTSAFPTTLLDDGGFETYELVQQDGKWLLNEVVQRDFTNDDHLNVTPKQAVQYLYTTDRGGDYKYVRTVKKEQTYGEGFQIRPYYVIQWTGENGQTDELLFDSYTGFTE